jgi:hypothetical protein
MKRFLKRIARALWKSAAPVRRPVIRKLDGYLERTLGPLIQGRIQPPLERMEAATHHAAHAINLLSHEMNLVLNSLIRETTRLQMHIEVLEQTLHQATQTRAELSVIGEAEEHDGYPHSPGERMKVG